PLATTPENEGQKGTTPEATTPEATTPEETTPAPATPAEPKAFHLEIGDPVVVTQGAVGDNAWGHYQFPGLAYTLDGNIVATWNYTSDTIDDYVNTVRKKVSTDGGLTWSDDASLNTTPDKFQMPNGKYFAGFRSANAHVSTWQNVYEPGYAWSASDGDYKLFFAEDLPKNEDTTVWGKEYDPETGKTVEFECTVNWPHASMVEYPGGKLYPMTQWFSLNQDNIIIKDGVMYLAMYTYGFNSYSTSREYASGDFCKYYSTYIFTSEDNGRTWNFLSQLSTLGQSIDFSEGLCEPCLNIMPDGSIMILMRSGGNSKPCYWARSTNNCKSWSVIKKFDDIGVLPQMVTLASGISIATYGRPYMRIRATADPTGKTWQPAQTFDMYSGENNSSCYYTDLLALDDTHALWIYSDFKYPNANGVPVKSIIVRVITVAFEE
ncbi:MAG: exo-alpha-sialidase, partial [Clostridia bacterium]|nr:exo-alpha-sialidase [Clostridia bacterium]